MAKQQEIKDELGEGATVTEVSKRSAEMWRNLPADERAYWDDVATKDKQRYMAEKATYTGPWQVPWKRAKKDPSAPKRPMSAFLYFSQERRRIIKEKNPGMRNTEVSRVLGDMWRNASEEERNPHIEREAREREKYKVAIAKWREEHEAKLEAQRKAQAEQVSYGAHAAMYSSNPPSDQSQQPPAGNMPYGDPNMMPPYMAPPGSMPYGSWGPYPQAPPPHGAYPPPMMYSPYPPPPSGPQGASGGKPVTVLGPNGMPQHQMPYGSNPSVPPGSYPPASYPPAQYPPGSYPPGSYPPGSYPPPQGYDQGYDQNSNQPAPAPYTYPNEQAPQEGQAQD